MPRDRGHLAQAGGVANAVFLLLPQLIFVEFPDAAVLFENRARVLARQLGRRSRCWQALEGAPTFTYSEPLPSKAMPLSPCCALFETGDDHFRPPAGFSWPGVILYRSTELIFATYR